MPCWAGLVPDLVSERRVVYCSGGDSITDLTTIFEICITISTHAPEIPAQPCCSGRKS